MANDDRSGDDLFEDLDKFFAPIKDVDWDEPGGEQAGTTPQEEHVAVRHEGTGVPAGHEGALPAESATSPAAASRSDALEDAVDERVEPGDDDDESWYDTGVLETVAELSIDDDDDPVFADDTVRIVDDAPPLDDSVDEPADAPAGAPADDQAGLFDEAGERDPTVASGAPSEDDLEAAAEHFAGSIREERYDTTPLEGDLASAAVDPYAAAEGAIDEGFDDDAGPAAGADLLSDLGAEAVEADILADLEPEPAHTVMVGTEGLGGPSWQEPAAVEVGADLERRGPDLGERDVPAAFMTGVVLAGVALASLLVGETAFAIIAALGVLAAQGELFGVMTKHHQQPATFVGLVVGQLVIWGTYFRGEASIPAMMALGLIATFLWFMTVPAAHRKQIMQNVGLTMLNVTWIALLAAYLLATLDLPDGRELVIAVIALTFVYDTSAFFLGSVWGGSFFQYPLAGSISPKKSLEGLIGGSAVVVVVSAAIVPAGFIETLDGARFEAVLLGFAIAVAATLGDLAESLVKRDLSVKDMGSVLPGHGGVLDRIDSLLFVAPAAYFLFRVVFVS